jgi:uncharacterized protein (DUF2336 family)
MSRPDPKPADQSQDITYEESKRLLEDPDPAVRAQLAARADVRPEVLYFLAGDDSADVRRQVAGNRRTPVQADLMLARDEDHEVRSDLVGKVAQLLPELNDRGQKQAQHFLVDTLEILARDQTTRVRRVLAETLKDMAAAPSSVIRSLAEDAEEVVACPVLQFSPLLDDQDLLEIIDSGCASGKLEAISRRESLAAPVADAIAATEDEPAVAALLSNESAQIREETLDQLIDKAPNVMAWHEPLVERSGLPSQAVRKLAGFVAEALLGRLQARAGLDEATADLVAEELRRRLEGGNGGADSEEAVAEKVAAMQAAGKLTEDALLEAVTRGERGFVRHAFARLAGLRPQVVEKVLLAGSAKAQISLVWKAGLTMRVATQLQMRMGGISPEQALRPGKDGSFPLSDTEMGWQLSMFQNMGA